MIDLFQLGEVQFFLLLFTFMFTNALVSAPPSELTIATAAFVVTSSAFSNAYWVIIVSLAGNLLGASLLYYLGKRYSESILSFLNKRLTGKFSIIPIAIQKFLLYVESGRVGWVFYTRFLPTIRSIGSLPAGMANIPFHIFFILTSLGCFIWIVLWTTIGMYVFDIYQQHGEISLLFSVAIIIVVLYLIKKKL